MGKVNHGTVIIVACTVVVTALVVRREFATWPPEPPRDAPTEVRKWREVAEQGTQYGTPSASVTITQFSDFQCPFCKRLHLTLQQLAAAFPGELGFSYRHFPIDNIHPHARAAAHAAECADAQGHFEQFQNTLFAEQDSIGLLPWGELAHRSGIIDTVAIRACMSEARIAARVQADEKEGKELGIRGTPMVLVNGRVIGGAPTYATLDSMVRLILARVP